MMMHHTLNDICVNICLDINWQSYTYMLTVVLVAIGLMACKENHTHMGAGRRQ